MKLTPSKQQGLYIGRWEEVNIISITCKGIFLIIEVDTSAMTWNSEADKQVDNPKELFDD